VKWNLWTQPDGVLIVKAGKLSRGKRVLGALLRGRQSQRRTLKLAAVDPSRGMILVDTSVIADILTKDPRLVRLVERSNRMLADQGPV